MAVFIKATYVKKLGLPQYSSHQYSIEVSAELTDLAQLPQASADLYARLQSAVDSQIAYAGYIPGESTPPGGPAERRALAPTNTSTNTAAPHVGEEPWKCSDKQRDLILKIVSEHQLDRNEVDALARRRFGAGVRQLNKLQASALIDELIEAHGRTEQPRRGGGGCRQQQYSERGRG